MKKKNLLSRTIIIVFVTLVGLYLVIGPRRRPTLHDFTWSGIKSTLRSNIHLGLDLQGGSHLVMRVKTEEYLKRLTSENYTAAQQAAMTAANRAREVGMRTVEVHVKGPGSGRDSAIRALQTAGIDDEGKQAG